MVDYTWSTGETCKFLSLSTLDACCVFLSDKACTVYAQRPLVCTLGPIIPPLYDGRHGFDNWYRENCLAARGCNKMDHSEELAINYHELGIVAAAYYSDFFGQALDSVVTYVKLARADRYIREEEK